MPAYHQAGFLNTTAADGRRLRVIYLHDDDSRDEAKVKQEVDVLRSFAAACKRGDGDIFGNTLPSRVYQCDVIWVRKGHHDSSSDARPHLAIQVSTEAEFMRSPKEAVSGLHVYSVQDEASRGYAGWRKMRSKKTPSKMGSAAVQQNVARALANDFGAGSRGPSPPSSPGTLSTVASN